MTFSEKLFFGTILYSLVLGGLVFSTQKMTWLKTLEILVASVFMSWLIAL